MRKLINWLLCKLGKHDNEFVNVEITYKLYDTTGFLNYPPGAEIGKRVTLYQKCKRCEFEKEVGT